MKILIVAMSLMLAMVIHAYPAETIVCKMDRSGMVDASCQKGDILLILGKVGESPEMNAIVRSLSAASLCDIDRPVIEIGNSSVICYYIGYVRQRERPGKIQ